MSRRLLAVTQVDHPGGAETTLLRLLGGLAAGGWEITLGSPGDGPMRRQALESGFRWCSLPVGALRRGGGAGAIRGWPRARRLAAEVDIVYLNGTVCARLLPALPRNQARRVLHVHDMVRRVPRFWRRADVVLAASRAVAERLPGLHPHVVYGPVDPDPPAVDPPWGPGEGPVIGFVGRLERRKGPLELVRAAPLLRRALPGARIILVGDDPYGTDPAYTAAVKRAAEVEHFGWVSNAPGLMRHLDVLVLPAREEPFGTVLSEAMILGTPVVATAVDGLPEVVVDGHGGRLVAPGDFHALAEAIIDVVRNRARMSPAARESAMRFATPAYVARVERLIDP